MSRRARVLEWNGKDLPPELQALPAGRYLLEAVDDDYELSEDEHRAIEAGLAAYRRGDVVPAARVRELVDAVLKR